MQKLSKAFAHIWYMCLACRARKWMTRNWTLERGTSGMDIHWKIWRPFWVHRSGRIWGSCGLWNSFIHNILLNSFVIGYFSRKAAPVGLPWVLQFHYVLLDEVEGWASPIAWRLLFICRTGTFGMFMVFAAQAMSFLVFGSKIANTCHLTLRFLWKLNTLTWTRAEIRGYKGDTWKT
jgi:hypothetical protein